MSDLVAFIRARLDEDEATTTMSDLVAFILARLDEDEANARDALALWGGSHITIDPGSLVIVKFHRDHDPARALREVAAKRAILALHYLDSDEYIDADGIERAAFICHECDNFGRSDNWPCRTLRHVAAIWSDHPDYDEEWRP